MPGLALIVGVVDPGKHKLARLVLRFRAGGGANPLECGSNNAAAVQHSTRTAATERKQRLNNRRLRPCLAIVCGGAVQNCAVAAGPGYGTSVNDSQVSGFQAKQTQVCCVASQGNRSA